MNGLNNALLRPPGPRDNHLFLGVLPQFRKDPAGYLQAAARTYGDLVYMRLGPQHVYVVSHPDWIRDILVTHQSKFTKSRILERAKVLLGEGLLTSEGELHTRQRRLVQPAFHRDRLARYAADMAACAENVSESWTAAGSGSCLDMHLEMTRLTLAIVGRTLFSADVSSDADEIGGAITQIFALFDTLLMPFADWLQKLPIPPVRRFEKARDKLDCIVYGLIAERRASGEDTGDLLSMLLLATDDEGAGERSRMSDKQVHDEALTLLIAGHETTANALTWTWYLLSQNPEVETRMHAEIDRVLCGKPPTFDDVQKLPYTTGVFAESLRLYPPAWAIGRRAKEDYPVGGYTIPAKSILLLSPWAVQRDARWFPDPERMDPDRWRTEENEKRPRFAFFPFGGGARVCIGEGFAWTEGVVVLATLAQRWKMRLAPGHPVTQHAVITLRPKYGMKMILEDRKILA